MKLEKLDNLNRSNEVFLYRYMTLEKLIPFLKNKSIYLTRSDRFDDNIESASAGNITDLNNSSRLVLNKINPVIGEERIQNLKRDHRYTFNSVLNEINKSQKERFISCWISDDVESIGMWDLYAPNGFVIRFDKKRLIEIIESSVSLNKHLDFDILCIGMIEYQNFDKINFHNEKENIQLYSCFRKHLTFKHENEFRMVGFARSRNELGLDYQLLNLIDIDFNIYYNPRMNDFNRKTFSEIISNYYKGEIKESQLKKWIYIREL